MKLALNCHVEYINDFLTREAADELYQVLVKDYEITKAKIKTSDNSDYLVNFGKIMFIDQELKAANKFPEQVWGNTSVWPDYLTAIRTQLEKLTQRIYQVCVGIYYPDGNSGVDYHSDFTAFGDTSVIPSLSLGEERMFYLREKETQKEHGILLENGSLIIMGENCQEKYEHALPINPKYQNPRINLTFRTYGY
jgi:2-oxoglutarate-Fe(II)-dependent oxygenase superfamily protein